MTVPTVKVLAIPATNSPQGLNRQLLEHAAGVVTEFAPDAVVEIVDLNDYEMPIYSSAREADDGVLEPARRLYEQIGDADAVMISFAEHNGSYSAAWKNVHDWMSRIDMGIYQGTKVAMFAATPGPRSGAGVLGAATTTAPFFGADLAGSLGVGSFFENFDAEAGAIVDPDLAAACRQLVGELVS